MICIGVFFSIGVTGAIIGYTRRRPIGDLLPPPSHELRDANIVAHSIQRAQEVLVTNDHIVDADETGVDKRGA